MFIKGGGGTLSSAMFIKGGGGGTLSSDLSQTFQQNDRHL